MAKLNLDYYSGEGGYTDGAVEIKLLEYLKEGKTPEEILSIDSSWPYFYHLSPIRENILNWYPFKKDCSILEIGSGCGAISNLLASRAKEVTSIELTKPRAEINFERNKDVDNLEIIVGNFHNIKLDKKYDYIILNGVLEYAGSFTDAEKPYLAFLESLEKFLKEDGILLIAIENRIGLKYINGAPEDHTNTLFDGINNYPTRDDIHTFTKNELIDLLHDANFDNIEVYYPFPDYKLPELIVTDKTVDRIPEEVSTDTVSLKRLNLFNEPQMFKALKKEGIAEHFLNSFLVAASREEIKDRKVEYAKFSSNRKKDFATITTIEQDNNGKKVVRKVPLFDEAKDHIKKMQDYYDLSHDFLSFPLVNAVSDDNSIAFDFIVGESYEDLLNRLLREGKKEEFENTIGSLKAYLYDNARSSDDFYTDEFIKVFGDKKADRELLVKDNNNIDIIFSNIINDGQSHVIDYEWIFNFPIPQEFILYRSLFFLYHSSPEVRDNYSFDELLKTFDINPELIPVFESWDEHFGNIYVAGVENQPDKLLTIDATSYLKQALEALDDESSIYLDFGDGSSEETRIKSKYKLNGEDFRVEFDLKPVIKSVNKPIMSIRWDPVESSCVLTDINIKTNTGDLNIYPFKPYASNLMISNDDIYFLDNDPYLLLMGDLGGVEKVTITGKIRRADLYMYQNALYTLNEKFDRLQQEAGELNKALKTKELEAQTLRNHIENFSADNQNLLNLYNQVNHNPVLRVSRKLQHILNLLRGK